MATKSAWVDINVHLKNKISISALHTLVHKERYGVKENLGISRVIPEKTVPETNLSWQSGKKNVNYYTLIRYMFV